MRSPDLASAGAGSGGVAGAGDAESAGAAPGGFRVRVGDFDGPFDLLLALIAKHELDITEIALSVVTDEFLTSLRGLDDDDLDRTSGFLVVGATLLDMKLAGLLPQGELVDAEDVALLEARDLLFARLLQYRAFKQAASWLEEALATEARHIPVPSRADEVPAGPPPTLDWTTTLAAFAELAGRVLTPIPVPVVDLGHLHDDRVSLREQAATIAAMLRGGRTLSFTELLGDRPAPGIVVARFLAVLELYRAGAVLFEQLEPLGSLLVRWSAENWRDDLLDALGRDWDGQH